MIPTAGLRRYNTAKMSIFVLRMVFLALNCFCQHHIFGVLHKEERPLKKGDLVFP
jgi:hypothetical protein